MIEWPIPSRDPKTVAVKLLLHALESYLLAVTEGASKRRGAELWTKLHKAADDVREVWGDEIL